jgi:hypothetical protein
MNGYALSAACLLAMLAIASCTADGLVPPVEITGGNPLQPTASAATPPLAPEAAVAQPGVDPQAATAAAPAPAFNGTQPSASLPQGDAGPVSATVASVTTTSTIQLAPITGSTEQSVAPLRQRIAERAGERGIGLAGNGMLPTHILRGYLSEISDAGSTTVIYVWDVVDPGGTRLHRIQGTAKIKGGGGWAAVSAETMKAIADRTIDDLARWLAGGTG